MADILDKGLSCAYCRRQVLALERKIAELKTRGAHREDSCIPWLPLPAHPEFADKTATHVEWHGLGPI